MKGKVSFFGGPDDSFVSEEERLALYPKHFCRKLNPEEYYCAIRMKYELMRDMQYREGKKVFQNCLAVEITNPQNNKLVICDIVDWGPGINERIIDLSPAVGRELDIETDDIVSIRLVINPQRSVSRLFLP